MHRDFCCKILDSADDLHERHHRELEGLYRQMVEAIWGVGR